MKTTMLLTLSLATLGCAVPVYETPGPDAAADVALGVDARESDVLELAPPDLAPELDSAGIAETLPDRAPVTADCHITMLAQAYQPGTARLTAPFLGVDPAELVIYLDEVKISRASWRLADDGHTLVISNDVPGGHAVGFSIGCTREG